MSLTCAVFMSWRPRMLPGLNAAAVGLIVGAVFLLTFQIYKASPFPNTTICIGAHPGRLVRVCKIKKHSLGKGLPRTSSSHRFIGSLAIPAVVRI